MPVRPEEGLTSHILGGVFHSSDTLANLSSKISDGDLASELFVQQFVQGIAYQESVKDKDLTTPVGGESLGDRFIVNSPATGDWVGQDEKIAEANINNPIAPGDWDFITPGEGWTIWIDDENRYYNYNEVYPGGSWVVLPSTDRFADLDFTTADITSIPNRSHTDMTGLGVDDHTQYGRLAGRAGGQTFYGGTLAVDSLMFKANSAGVHTNITLLGTSGITMDTDPFGSIIFRNNSLNVASVEVTGLSTRRNMPITGHSSEGDLKLRSRENDWGTEIEFTQASGILLKSGAVGAPPLVASILTTGLAMNNLPVFFDSGATKKIEWSVGSARFEANDKLYSSGGFIGDGSLLTGLPGADWLADMIYKGANPAEIIGGEETGDYLRIFGNSFDATSGGMVFQSDGRIQFYRGHASTLIAEFTAAGLLDMKGNNIITGAGLVDGVDVGSHGALHAFGGAQAISQLDESNNISDYAVLNGRVGSQILYGGTQTGEQLELRANSVDPTQPYILIRANNVVNRDLELHSLGHGNSYTQFIADYSGLPVVTIGDKGISLLNQRSLFGSNLPGGHLRLQATTNSTKGKILNTDDVALFPNKNLYFNELTATVGMIYDSSVNKLRQFAPTGYGHIFRLGAVDIGQFSDGGLTMYNKDITLGQNNPGTLFGGTDTTTNLNLKANFIDSYPRIRLIGNEYINYHTATGESHNFYVGGVFKGEINTTGFYTNEQITIEKLSGYTTSWIECFDDNGWSRLAFTSSGVLNIRDSANALKFSVGVTGEILNGTIDWSKLLNKPSTFTPTLHASAHLKDAGDEIFIEALGTAGTVGQIPVSDGAGGVGMATKRVKQMLNIASSYPVALVSNTSGWIRIGSVLGVTSTEDRAKRRMPKCVVTAINGRVNSSGDVNFTVRKNGVDTTLTGNVTAVGKYRITGSVAFADGDEISLYYDTAPSGGISISGIVAEYEVDLI